MAQLGNHEHYLRSNTGAINKYLYSPMISERRRNLFPSKDAQIDHELGNIQPLNYGSCSNSETSDNEDNNISDYELIEPVDKQGFSTPLSKERNCAVEHMSPLYLSPFTTTSEAGKSSRKFSPSQNLKTPHDTCAKSSFPKLQRDLLEESKSCKRMDGSLSSPKQDASPELRSGKVRTALFSTDDNEQDISVPTKSFYAKSCGDISDILSSNRERTLPKPAKVVSSRIGYRYNKKFGQINNGVRHKIKKPKLRKLTKLAYGKAGKTMVETNDALNEYIQDIAAMRKASAENSASKKLIVNASLVSRNDANVDPTLKNYLNDLEELNHFGNGYNKLIQHSGREDRKISEGNKENVPLETRKRHLSLENCDEHSNRKFFKSNREKPIINIEGFCHFEESTSLSERNKESGLTSQKINTENSVFDPIIDENEEIVPNMNIDNILTALDDSDNFVHSDSDLFLNSMNIVNSDFSISNQNCGNSSNFSQIVPSYTQNNTLNNVPPTSFYDSGSPMSEILNTSFEGPSQTPPNQVTLEAYTSISASENSIQLHDHILSPISQMCDVTSGLVLTDSPKRGRNLASVLNNLPNAGNTNLFGSADNQTYSFENDSMEQQKLFPIFCGAVRPTTNGGEKRENKESRRTPAKKFKRLPQGQMLLDAGQKRFGFVLCEVCDIIYHAGDPGDELHHQNYHEGVHIFRFAGWKNEHLVADFDKNGRIIKVLPTDSKIWIKKVQDLIGFVNRELGCYDGKEYDISGSEVYLYIKTRTIVGCVVATVPKFGGHRMLSGLDQVSLCTELSYPIKCGISRIWVSRNYRKQGIARALMDAVKRSFVLGSILTNDDIALTSPTDDGMAFATKYFKTRNYLIYYPYDRRI